jgi:hypothetical protein
VGAAENLVAERLRVIETLKFGRHGSRASAISSLSASASNWSLSASCALSLVSPSSPSPRWSSADWSCESWLSL